METATQAIVATLAVASRLALYINAAATSDAYGHTFHDDGPSTSFSSVREGRFLLQQALSPYAGSACRHPPLLLLALAALPDIAVLGLLIAADAAIAWLLLARLGGRSAATRGAAALLYLLSPWTIASCAALGTAALQHVPLLGALALAHAGRATLAGAALAVATCLAFDAAWMLPATAVLLARGETGAGLTSLVSLLGTWSACLLAQLLLSYAALRSWDFVGPVYLSWAHAHDSRPNGGAWWYLLSQVLLPARPVFVLALHALPHLCMAPLALRLRRTPMVGAALSLGVVAAFKPFPTATDQLVAVAAMLAQLEQPLLERARRMPVAVGAMLLGLATGHPLRDRWLEARAFNANFYYVATVVLSAGHALLVCDLAAAAVDRGERMTRGEAACTLQRVVRRRRSTHASAGAEGATAIGIGVRASSRAP
jgi:phosphatidylinositol glycan class U